MSLFIVLVWCSPEYNVQSFSFRRSQGRNGLKAKMTEQHARNGSTVHASDVWPSRVVIIGWGRRGKASSSKEHRSFDLFVIVLPFLCFLVCSFMFQSHGVLQVCRLRREHGDVVLHTPLDLLICPMALEAKHTTLRLYLRLLVSQVDLAAAADLD